MQNFSVRLIFKILEPLGLSEGVKKYLTKAQRKQKAGVTISATLPQRD